MCSAEFAEWMAFERLEGPLGPEREDWRVALIASTIANANRDPKKHRAYTPTDFIPEWAAQAGVKPLEEAKTAEEVASIGKSWFRRLAAKGRAGN